jgi:CRISPR-associated protein Cmx8
MAKSKPPETIPPITYDLFELPTAQHRAGLAGLLLQIDSMKNRGKPAPTYRWDTDEPSTKVHVEFTEETMRSLFNDAYAAEVAEEWFPQRKKKEHLKAKRLRETRSGKVPEFLHDWTRPTLPTLRHYLGGGPSAEAWLKLWKDMLWAVPRGVNTTRIPFEVVAGWGRKKQSDARRVAPAECPEGASSWASLCNFCKPSKRTRLSVVVKGHLWLGAQESTAEAVDFVGRLDQNLLLHFWQFASLVYIPQSFKVVREQGRTEAKRRFVGYAIAIPDVIDLPAFLERFPQTLHDLGSQPAPKGKRPELATVEIPAESALSLIDRDRLAGLARQKASGGEFRYSITGVDYFHFLPGKNGAKMLSAGRVELREHLIEDYESIACADGGKPRFRNPLFRRALMQHLLADIPWFQPFGKVFHEWPAEFFVPSEKSPQKLSWFWTDARKKLQEVIQSMTTEPNDPPPGEDDLLAATINRFIRHYLDQRLKADADYDFAAFRKAKATPPEAAEARRKMGERLFLEFRSRRDQAFTDHFTGTFFRVEQYMGRDFEKIAKALITQTDKVKTLTLMALSANSWVPSPKKTETAK